MSLFENLSDSAVLRAIESCDGVVRRFKKNEPVYRAGEMAQTVGVLLSGRIYVNRVDSGGQYSLVLILQPGETVGIPPRLCECDSIFSAHAAEDIKILFLNYQKVVDLGFQMAAESDRTLLLNLMNSISKTAIKLRDKVSILVHKQLRMRILAYFFQCAKAAGSSSFALQMSKSNLADFLCINRSAMTRELKRMAEEGLLSVSSNRVELFVSEIDFLPAP